MAGAHGATMSAAAAISSSSVPPTTSAALIPGKSLVLLSSLPSSFPSRRRRTNHLRKKILKTLENKPYPDISNPEFPLKTPPIAIEETVQQQITETDQLSLSQTTGFLDGIAEGEDRNLNSDEYKKPRALDSKENPNSMETTEGGILLVDKSEMDNRIVEIQEMARDARQQERVEAKRKGLVEEEEDDDDIDIDHDLIDKSLKEKEVDNRLMKLRKSLEGEKPKGFDKTKDLHVVNGEFDNKDQEQVDESIPIIEPINKLVNGSEKTKQRATKTESIKGASKEIRKPRGFGQESQSNASISSKNDDSYSNGSLKGKKGRNRKSGGDFGDMKISSKIDFWWTSLPYVLAILMQRGGKSEESEGLFTLRSNFKSKSGLSHTVAFEDRGDATNFCYLLESFFQDLEDFTTNIIPIPTNELEDAVKSEIMKVVVVKKGQLQLYVGQPLTDVESALRTLIQQQTK
ncbi:unnamed protein product [Lactuca saligna]|uniref:Uncharacterized protein n=1 Tax=Lactuca saligna TaxID=75948 RepID=A0AA35VH04_LACSI|nr:unnamed protein product [Lactuca saligna]